MLLLALNLIACTAPEATHDGISVETLLREQETDEGRYVVYWRSIPDPMQYGIQGEVDLRITDGLSPTEPVEATVFFTGEPDGGDSIAWDVEPREDGHHRATNVELSTTGWWSWRVEVEGDAGSDAVTFRYFCCRRDDTG